MAVTLSTKAIVILLLCLIVFLLIVTGFGSNIASGLNYVSSVFGDWAGKVNIEVFK